MPVPLNICPEAHSPNCPSNTQCQHPPIKLSWISPQHLSPIPGPPACLSEQLPFHHPIKLTHMSFRTTPRSHPIGTPKNVPLNVPQNHPLPFILLPQPLKCHNCLPRSVPQNCSLKCTPKCFPQFPGVFSKSIPLYDPIDCPKNVLPQNFSNVL